MFLFLLLSASNFIFYNRLSTKRTFNFKLLVWKLASKLNSDLKHKFNKINFDYIPCYSIRFAFYSNLFIFQSVILRLNYNLLIFIHWYLILKCLKFFFGLILLVDKNESFSSFEKTVGRKYSFRSPQQN